METFPFDIILRDCFSFQRRRRQPATADRDGGYEADSQNEEPYSDDSSCYSSGPECEVSLDLNKNLYRVNNMYSNCSRPKEIARN